VLLDLIRHVQPATAALKAIAEHPGPGLHPLHHHQHQHHHHHHHQQQQQQQGPDRSSRSGAGAASQPPQLRHMAGWVRHMAGLLN